MDKKFTIETLEKFNKYVIQQARANLTKAGKNDTGGLYDSFKSTVNVSDNSIVESSIGSAKYNEYGIFQDKGVRGFGGVRKTTSLFNSRNNKGKIWKQKGGDSPFSYKDKKPPISALKAWAEKRGLSPYAIQESVYRQGIAPIHFFDKPFEVAFERLPDDLVKAYGLDLDSFIEFTLKE